MSPKSLAKIYNAGFVILRRYEHHKTIKVLEVQKTTNQPHPTDINFIPENLSWQKLEGPFESKAAMNRRMDELLEDEITVEA